ncbi:MAG: glycosyltransferase [Candidatus Pacebacteria bacterium]|nr:glycosyltransferase [Candidatus Paceibacterota bacterium]
MADNQKNSPKKNEKKESSKAGSLNHSVSVIIPTYNGLDLLKQNLPASLKLLRPNDELIVVDDASTDQTVSFLTDQFKLEPVGRFDDALIFEGKLENQAKIKLAVNQVNQRFALNSNRGVNLAENELIFLINNDVYPEPDVFEFLLPWFEDRELFAVGCLEIETNLGGIKGGKNKLWFERGMFFHSRADDFQTGPTAWVSGGSGMFDRQKWLMLDGFDPLFYPAYWEDVDLSFRARKRGWKVMFEARAQVEHNHETTNQSAFGQAKMERISWRNANKFVWKNGTIWQKLSHVFWLPYWWYQRNKSDLREIERGRES